MNARQALWWEELRVGGPIAATCLAVGLAGQASLALAWGRAWHAVDSLVLTATLGVPMMLALALTLNTANTGHLAGGFSRRILRLPVDTRTAVAVALLTRLILVAVSAGILMVACWLLYGHGPGPRAILFLAGTYLLIQVLDWSRAVAAWLAPVVILLFVYVLSVSPGGLNAWARALSAEGARVTSSSLVAFGLGLMLAYTLSLFFVSRTRRGRRFSLLVTQTFNEALALPWTRSRKPFASPLAAQIWCERKRAGFSFPALVVVCWVLCLAVRWLAVESLSDQSLSSHKDAPVFFDPTWSFDIPPLIALALASFAWTLRRKMTHAEKGSPFAYMRWLPLHKEEMARARLAVAGRNLAVCLGVITVVSAVSLLFAGGGWFGKLFWGALHRGETNLREVLAVLLGPSLLAGLVCWIILGGAGQPLRRRSFITGLIVMALGAWLVTASLPNWAPRNMATGIGCMIFVFAVLLPPAVLIARLAGAWRRGLLTLRMVAVNVFLWGLVTVFLFPFSFEGESFQKPIFLPMSLALAALAVSPYVSTTLAFAYRVADGCVANEKPPVRRRNTKGNPLSRAFVTLSLLAVVAFLAWLRWPAESAWQRTWRAEGLPTNLEELNDWYTPVPLDRNLAVLYLKASREYGRKEAQWWKEPEIEASPGYHDILEKIVVVGGANFRTTGQIPPDVWRWTKKYWDTVTREVCPDLHAAARSGRTASRYPADLRRGYAADLQYLAGVRALGRQLTLDSLVASVEGRSDAEVDDILDLFPLANSLENEPVLTSQLVRVAVLGMAVGSVERVLNRAGLSDVEFRRLQDGFSHALPPIEQHRVMDRATIGEEVMALTYSLTYYRPRSFLLGGSRDSLAALLADGCWVPLRDLMGFDAFGRVILTSGMASTRESARSAAERHCSIEDTVPDTFWTSPTIALRGWWAAWMMPYFYQRYDAEWGCRTQMDLAQTAVAVQRFRLANARLPTTLDELIPTYLDRIPLDFWNPGQPLSYLIKDNGEFVIYSRHLDYLRADRPSEGAPEGPRWARYDLTFTVAPPEIRNHPSPAE